MTPQAILPGALAFVDALCGKKLKTAVASSSKNAPFILERLRLADTFDAVVSGNDIAKSKPDPEVFLTAARRLETAPAVCLVVEDSLAGIEAAKAGGMRALGVGFAARSPLADFHAESLATASVDSLLRGLPA